MAYTHKPVMIEECLEGLAIKPGGLYIDATTGLGGHSEQILRRGARLICLDKDQSALDRTAQRLAEYGDRVCFVKSDFRHMEQVMDSLGHADADGILLDLGVSSMQLDDPERGFSYRHEAPLDMRMDSSAALTAHEVVNEWPMDRLKQIFYDYGEERYSDLIAAAIARYRPIDTTTALSDIICSAMPAKARREAQHPARRCFQALRICVNDELGAVEEGVAAAIRLLRPGGRLCVISFHSLEDREVKRQIADGAKGCTCPPSFPVCVCGKTPLLKPVGRYVPASQEIDMNPRAGSARLRVAEKL